MWDLERIANSQVAMLHSFHIVDVLMRNGLFEDLQGKSRPVEEN